MHRPYSPVIESDAETGEFRVADPEPPALPLVRNPITGRMEEARESPDAKIAKLLMQSLREGSDRPSGSPGRVPAHLRQYVTK